MASCTAEPMDSAAVTPRPISTALTAWRLITACASRPSRRSSQFVCVPMPGGRPCVTTSKMPDRVSGAEDLIDFRLHALLGFGVDAVEKDRLLLREIDELLPHVRALQLCLSDADDMREDLNAEFAQKHLGDGSARNARRGLARRSAFEDVARIGKVVLQCARQIGVAGAGRGHCLVLLRIAAFDGKDLFPVLPVAIGYLHGDGRTDGLAMAHAGADMRCVALNPHTSAATVALLATPELVREELLVNGNTCGETAEEGNERLSVALASCRKSKHFYPLPKEKL